MSNSLWPHGVHSPWNSPGQNTGVGSHPLLQGIFPTQGSNLGLLRCRGILYQLRWGEGEVSQSCPTLCGPVDCSLPGSSVHGILQARILEWLAISFSRGSSQPRDRTWVSCVAYITFPVCRLSEPPGEVPVIWFGAVTKYQVFCYISGYNRLKLFLNLILWLCEWWP